MVRFAKTFVGVVFLLLVSCSPEQEKEEVVTCQTDEVYELSHDLALMPKLHEFKDQSIRKLWWCKGNEGLLRLRPKGKKGEEFAKYLIEEYEDNAHFKLKLAPGREPGEAKFFTITVGGDK